jgi:hypothetical protein
VHGLPTAQLRPGPTTLTADVRADSMLGSVYGHKHQTISLPPQVALCRRLLLHIAQPPNMSDPRLKVIIIGGGLSITHLIRLDYTEKHSAL